MSILIKIVSTTIMIWKKQQINHNTMAMKKKQKFSKARADSGSSIGKSNRDEGRVVNCSIVTGVKRLSRD